MAVDQEPEFTEFGRLKASRLGVDNVVWVTSSAETLSLSGQFDAVAVGNAFHRLRRRETIDHVMPNLRVGGCVALLWSWSPWTGEQQWQRTLAELMERWRDLAGARDRVPPGWEAAIEAAPHRQVLREAGLDPRRLELEVTESLFIEDNHATSAFIDELSALGVRFALDDFGTGYSSLGYINKFPFSKIKVDRSFVSGAQVGKKSDAIIRAVAEMGTTLGMDIVAEGLETIEQVQVVRDAGCNLGQGFYFSRAVPDYLAAMLLAQEREELYRKAIG